MTFTISSRSCCTILRSVPPRKWSNKVGWVPRPVRIDFHTEVLMSPLQSLVACGTKLWLDSIDPDLVKRDRAEGATGATSNPIIISDLIRTSRFDGSIQRLVKEGLSDSEVAWRLTDELVKQAQAVFLPVWEETKGNDGYVSFELDPLLEDLQANMPHQERVGQYIELGKKWSAGHKNRMIK